MSNVDNVTDKELAEYLQGGSEHSRRYQAMASDDVPPELDRLILAQAADTRGAIVPLLSRSRLSTWMRVGVPVSLAASAVLVVSIVMQSDTGRDSAPTAYQQVAKVSLDEPAPPPPMVQQPAAIPASAPAERTASRVSDELRAKAAAYPAAPAPVAAPPAELARVVTTEEPIRAVAEEAALPVDDRAVAGPTRAEKKLTKDATPTVQAVADERKREEVVVTQTYARQDMPSASLSSRSTTPANYSQRERGQMELDQAAREMDPGKWLTYIRELRAAKKEREADREWQRFIKQYPQHEVAADDVARPKK